jgi:aldehyde dehydrogenase (NAD+)
MSTATSHELLPEVAEFLNRGPLPSFVGGKPFPAASGKTVATTDPGSGNQLTEIHDLDASEIDQAVDIANAAFPAWAAMPQDQRSSLLLKLADAVEEHKAIIGQIESLDAGKIEAQAQGDVQNFADTLRYFVKLSEQVETRTKLDSPGHEAWTFLGISLFY